MLAKFKSQPDNLKRKIIFGALFAVLVLILISTWLWWHFVFTSPRRVFTSMLETGLRTSSFTKRISDQSDGQNLDQVIQITTGAKNGGHSVTTLSQASPNDAVVKTESIGTLSSDYVRYTSVKTSQKNAEGKELDFSDVINVWAKASNSNDPQATGQLFSDGLLGVVPLYRLNENDRQKLLKFIADNKVYSPNYTNVHRTKSNGRKIYTYEVDVNAEKYIEMLKLFGKMVGLNQLDSLDSTAYSSRPPIKIELSVDVLSRQLTKIKYTGSDRQEAYTGFGAISHVNIPNTTISVEDLQGRLQKVQ